MSAIVSNTTTFLSHYLSYKNVSSDFPKLANVAVTGATTLSASNVASVGVATPLMGAGKKLFVVVDSITDIATDLTLVMKDGGTTLGTAVIKAHSGIDMIYPIMNASSFDITAPATSLSFTVTGGSANVALFVISIDDSAWLNLGENFNEGVQFTKGVMSTPVARGWNATDHAVRVRTTCQFSIRQLYCSMLEGIAHLRGKTVLIKDEVRPDGGSVAKEIHFITGAQFENASLEIGGGGGNAGVDSVTGSGYFRRMYTWLCDASVLAASL